MVALPLRIRAVFHDGKFVPSEPCALPEASEVELVVQAPGIVPPAISDPAERARVLDEVVRRMMAQPLPADAPRLTRDQMHERR
jgi:hypothetical protein